MTKIQKDRSQTGNPVRHHDLRVGLSSPQDEDSVETLSSRDDKASFEFSFWLGVDILMQGRSCSPGVVGSFKRLLNNVLSESDMLGYIEACSAIHESLLKHGMWDRGALKLLSLRWVRGLVLAVEHAVPTSLCVHPSNVFDTTLTFLGWLKRLPICIRSTSDSVSDYLGNDRRLRSIQFDRNLYVTDLAQIWTEWFGSFRILDPFLPQHGSGSTADVGRVRAHKWRSLAIDTVAHVCFHYPNLDKALDLPRGSLRRTSKVVFVPKQAGKDRTICMEPATLQYLQQGVARQLVEFTHRANHPMSKLVDLYSQDRNRSLCAQAEMLKLATIDLSDASDSVSWRLIRRLCIGTPLHAYLYGSRSFTTILDGKEYTFDKFAPMGSALCFPVECMLFASVVELAFRLHYGQASKGHLSGCSVYGDDIICPSEIYYLVVDILESLGFKVNSQKSFSTGNYYESCGVEYLDSVRINTIRHPRSHLFSKGMVSPDEVTMVSDLANTLRQHGYFQARRNLLTSFNKVKVRIGNRAVPFMDLMDFSELGCIPIESSYHRLAWSDELQCSGRRVWSCQLVAKKTEWDFLEWKSHYVSSLPRTITSVHPKWSDKAITCLSQFKWFELLENGDIEDVGSRRTGRMRYILRRRFRAHYSGQPPKI